MLFLLKSIFEKVPAFYRLLVIILLTMIGTFFMAGSNQGLFVFKCECHAFISVDRYVAVARLKLGLHGQARYNSNTKPTAF